MWNANLKNHFRQWTIGTGTEKECGEAPAMERSIQLHSEYIYAPVAVYYGEADSLEYVRRDEPSVSRRIDEVLTLVLSMRTREPLGFRLKGFRHFYLKYLRGRLQDDEESFLEVVLILEEALRAVGEEIFTKKNRLDAYVKAQEIAKEDGVTLERGQLCA